MANIVHITDVHIDGTWGNQYNPEGNFKNVLADIPHNTQMVVITGDVADDNHKANYEKVRNMIQSAKESRGMDFKLRIIPGNHDDKGILAEVFPDEYRADCFETDTNNTFVLFPVHNYRIIYLDTADGFVSKKGKDVLLENPNSIVFSHIPIYPVKQEYMERHDWAMLKNRADIIPIIDACHDNVFCGHLHRSHEGFNQYVTYSTQMQMDPYSIDFGIGSIKPGYRIITLDSCELTDTKSIML